MPTRTANVFGRVIRTATKVNLANCTDRELLHRFSETQEEPAFAVLVERYSNMVLGVCRRTLIHVQDAEDACQATFLLLSQKASKGRWQTSVANWLYTTARKVAANSKRSSERRRKREGLAAIPEATAPIDQMSGRELLALLDEELDKLPAMYREVLVLHYLQGFSREETATQIGCPEPTIKTRLERGRKRLEVALHKRGVGLLGLLTLVVTSPARASSPQFREALYATVFGKPSQTVATLAQGVAMHTIMKKIVVSIFALISLTIMGIGVQRSNLNATDQPETKKAVPAKDKNQPAEKQIMIRGVVFGPDGKPVLGASIRTSRPPKNKDQRAEMVELAQTDAEGKFTVTVDRLARGRINTQQLVAVKSGYGSDWITISDSLAGQATFQLVADDIPVKGRITDLEGKPVPGAIIELGALQTTESGDLKIVWEDWQRAGQLGLQRANKLLYFSPMAAGLPETIRADKEGKFEIKGIGRNRILTLSFTGDPIAHTTTRVTTDPDFDTKKIESRRETTMGIGRSDYSIYGSNFTYVGKPSQTVSGVITDAKTGKPIPNVQIMGSPQNYMDNHVSTMADAEGKFTLKGLAKAKAYNLMVLPKPEQSYFSIHVTVSAEPGLNEVQSNIKLQRGVLLKGRITDKATGAPIFGAAIRYEVLADNKYQDNLLKGVSNTPGMAWTADKEGRFSMVILPGSGILTAQGETRGPMGGSEYTQVRVSEADLAKADRSQLDSMGELFTGFDGRMIAIQNMSAYKLIEPKETDEIYEVEMQFDAGKTVTGKVLDSDGKPAKNVVAHRLLACYDRPQKLIDGQFQAIALEPEHPRVVLFMDHANKQSAAITLKGDEKDLTVRLRPWGQLHGRLLDAKGQPLAGVKVRTNVANVIMHGAYRAGTRDLFALTATDGTFTLELPEGDVGYHLYFTHNGKILNTGDRSRRNRWAVESSKTLAVGDIQVKEE